MKPGGEGTTCRHHKVWIDVGDAEDEMIELIDPIESSEEDNLQELMPARQPVFDYASHCEDSLGLLQEMHVDSINRCDEKVEEWEELEFFVDSGASATVVGKDQVRAVKAADPDPNRWYKIADGSIIQNKGMTAFNAVAEDGGSAPYQCRSDGRR